MNLGICYERGIYGVEKNLNKAKVFFKEAADLGDLDGKFFYAIYMMKDSLYSGD